MPKSTWSCSCPDFQRAKKAMLYTRGYSNSLDRDWGDSMSADNNPKTIYCKHIWSEIRRRGELLPSQVPTDIPFPIGGLKKDVLPPWIPDRGHYMGIPELEDVNQKG